MLRDEVQFFYGTFVGVGCITLLISLAGFGFFDG